MHQNGGRPGVRPTWISGRTPCTCTRRGSDHGEHRAGRIDSPARAQAICRIGECRSSGRAPAGQVLPRIASETKQDPMHQKRQLSRRTAGADCGQNPMHQCTCGFWPAAPWPRGDRAVRVGCDSCTRAQATCRKRGSGSSGLVAAVQCMAGQSVSLATLVCQAHGCRGLGTLCQPAPLPEPLADFEPSQAVPREGKTCARRVVVPPRWARGYATAMPSRSAIAFPRLYRAFNSPPPMPTRLSVVAGASFLSIEES